MEAVGIRVGFAVDSTPQAETINNKGVKNQISLRIGNRSYQLIGCPHNQEYFCISDLYDLGGDEQNDPIYGYN